MDAAGTVLQVTNLTTYRGRAHILRDVSLTVRRDEVVCLVGRNGAGKTTTMDSIMGLLPVRAGEIRLSGQNITRLPTHRRVQSGIGYAPEDTGVFPDLTVEENLRIALWLGNTGDGAGSDVGPAHVYELFPELRGLSGRRGFHRRSGGHADYSWIDKNWSRCFGRRPVLSGRGRASLCSSSQASWR